MYGANSRRGGDPRFLAACSCRTRRSTPSAWGRRRSPPQAGFARGPGGARDRRARRGSPGVAGNLGICAAHAGLPRHADGGVRIGRAGRRYSLHVGGIWTRARLVSGSADARSPVFLQGAPCRAANRTCGRARRARSRIALRRVGKAGTGAIHVAASERIECETWGRRTSGLPADQPLEVPDRPVGRAKEPVIRTHRVCSSLVHPVRLRDRSMAQTVGSLCSKL